MADTIQTSEAPAEENSGAEPTTISTLEDLTQSFMDQVQEDAKAVDEATEEKKESSPEADASTDQNVLSNLVSESDSESDEVEEEEVEDPEESEEPPKAVGKLLKQVNKLTSRAKTAEENVLSLQNEIKNLKQNQPATSEVQSDQIELDNIQTFEELDSLKEQALGAKKFCPSKPGQDYVEENGKETPQRI